MDKLEVVSPAGLQAVAPSGLAPRLDSLPSKTVCEIWNGVFKGDVTFPAIRELLRQRYPDVEVVPYTEFPYAPGSDNPLRQRELARAIAALVKEKGCDAVISGNAA